MDITPVDLQALLENREAHPFRLVDVREEDEFHLCKISGAELIPLSRFMEEAAQKLPNSELPVVVYCHHGVRSAHAAKLLRRMGHEGPISNLTGGIAAWADEVEPEMRRY